MGQIAEAIKPYLPVAFWYLQGGLTIVIAFITVYIARQQWKTNAQKIKLDLFDRRFLVFEATRGIIGQMYTSGVKDKELVEFLTKTVEAGFLFGSEIEDYRNEVYRRVQSLIGANQRMNASWPAPPEVRRPIAEAEREEVEWASNQARTQAIEAKFKKYLDFSRL
jgi:hypothetical protein